MRATPSISTILLFGTYLCATSACTSVLMNTPVSKTANGWALTLSQVKEGPDEYVGEGGVLVESGEGQKLIWTLLTVRNQGTQEESFSYDACLLTGPGQSRPPSIVDKNAGDVNTAADRSEAFGPGQDRTRLLVYTYVKDKRPTAVKCEDIVLPIPPAR